MNKSCNETQIGDWCYWLANGTEVSLFFCYDNYQCQCFDHKGLSGKNCDQVSWKSYMLIVVFLFVNIVALLILMKSLHMSHQLYINNCIDVKMPAQQMIVMLSISIIWMGISGTLQTYALLYDPTIFVKSKFIEYISGQVFFMLTYINMQIVLQFFVKTLKILNVEFKHSKYVPIFLTLNCMFQIFSCYILYDQVAILRQITSFIGLSSAIIWILLIISGIKVLVKTVEVNVGTSDKIRNFLIELKQLLYTMKILVTPVIIAACFKMSMPLYTFKRDVNDPIIYSFISLIGLKLEFFFCIKCQNHIESKSNKRTSKRTSKSSKRGIKISPTEKSNSSSETSKTSEFDSHRNSINTSTTNTE